MEGNLTWKDGATGVFIVASGVAMATGVGEVAMGGSDFSVGYLEFVLNYILWKILDVI